MEHWVQRKPSFCNDSCHTTQRNLNLFISWWFVLINTVFRRLKQKHDCLHSKSKSSLGYVASSCFKWKKKEENKRNSSNRSHSDQTSGNSKFWAVWWQKRTSQNFYLVSLVTWDCGKSCTDSGQSSHSLYIKQEQPSLYLPLGHYKDKQNDLCEMFDKKQSIIPCLAALPSYSLILCLKHCDHSGFGLCYTLGCFWFWGFWSGLGSWGSM